MHQPRNIIGSFTPLLASSLLWVKGSKEEKRVYLNETLLPAGKLPRAVRRTVLRCENLSDLVRERWVWRARVCWRSFYFPQFSPKHVCVIWLFGLWPAFQTKRCLGGGHERSGGTTGLISDIQAINLSYQQANEPLSYYCVLCQTRSFLASYPVSITLSCEAPLSHFHSIGHLPKFFWSGGTGNRQRRKGGREGSHYRSEYEMTHLILRAKPLQWQLKWNSYSVSSVHSLKWYCLWQSLNIMSWVCKYTSMAYDHPPKRNSKGSKKKQMPSCRFLFQWGL